MCIALYIVDICICRIRVKYILLVEHTYNIK